MNEIEIAFTLIHILAFIIAILIIYFSVILIKRLDSEDYIVSMIFLHEKEINNIFFVLVIGSVLFLLGHSYNLLISNNTILVNVMGLVYSIALLNFVYGLQKLLIKEGK
jgi:hypothetical protein